MPEPHDPSLPSVGEVVRFRRPGRDRPDTATVVRVIHRNEHVEVTVRDRDGASRTFRLDAVELRRPGRRGHLEWRTASELGDEVVQRSLFVDDPPAIGR